MLKTKTKYDYRDELCQALRSGKFKQGRGVISYRYASRNNACVLGVAKLVFGIPGHARSSEYTYLSRLLDIDYQALYKLNDGSCDNKPQTFQQIADWIEAQP